MTGIGGILLCMTKETEQTQNSHEDMSKMYNHLLVFYDYKNKINRFNSGLEKKGSLILTFQKRKTP